MDERDNCIDGTEEVLLSEEEVEVAAEEDVIAELADTADEDVPEVDQASELERMKTAAAEAAAVSIRMKQEYEQAKRAEKHRRKASSQRESNGKGVSAAACIGISAATAAVAFVIAFAALFFIKMPSGESFMATFVKNYHSYFSSSEGNGSNTENGSAVNTPSDTIVGGTSVPGGSDVTINIEGDSSINAASVYAKCEQSIVGIRVVAASSTASWKNEYTVVGEGSGVIYSEDGYIITNHHVIADAISSSGTLNYNYEIRVYFDEELTVYSTASVIGTDETTDLAVIKIKAENLTPVEITDSDSIAVGDQVFAIGSPGGLEFMNSLSEGIVSGVGRDVTTDSGVAYDLIQTTTAINPGNSGGALLNEKGELIGICFLKIVASGYEGMGFAIPSNTVTEIVSTLIESGKVARPQIGIQVNTYYTATEAELAGLPAGAWIETVTEGGAAAAAGIEASSIITAFDGKAISDYTGLREELLKHKPGDSVVLTIYIYNKATGDGEYKDYTVVLGESE